MGEQDGIGQPRTFMIAGNDDEGDVVLRKVKQHLVGQIDDFWGDFAAKEKITPVDDKIGPGFDSMPEDPLKIIEKIVSSSSALYSGPDRIIEAEMGIGQQNHADVCGLSYHQTLTYKNLFTNTNRAWNDK